MRIINEGAETVRPPKILIYGPAGVGKSTLIARSAPRPCLYLDFDGGGTSYLAHAKDEDGNPLVELAGLVRAVDIRPEDVSNMVTRMRTQGVGRYKSLVVDSLTLMQIRHREHILGVRLQAARSDYGENGEWCRRMIMAMIDLDITLVVICLDDYDVTEDGPLVRPAVTPALYKSLEGVIDVVGYYATNTTEKEGLTRMLITGGLRTVRAKDRTSKLPATNIADPTGYEIFESLIGPDYIRPEQWAKEEQEKKEQEAAGPETSTDSSLVIIANKES